MFVDREHIITRLFSDGEQYDRYLRERHIEPHDGSRARGIQYSDGSAEVVIHTDYFLSGGISQAQLQALVVHEITELEYPDGDSSAELAAIRAEFQYILGHYGQAGLRAYHSNMGNLLGATHADTRNAVFQELMNP